MNLKISSSVFENNSYIPKKYTCDGDGINPPLEISGIPEETKSLVLIVDDPDAPSGVWDHWVKFNISTNTAKIEEGNENFGISGRGTEGSLSYKGPCPPFGTHHYVFHLYALDINLSLLEGVTKKEVISNMIGHILEQTEIVGLYKR